MTLLSQRFPAGRRVLLTPETLWIAAICVDLIADQDPKEAEGLREIRDDLRRASLDTDRDPEPDEFGPCNLVKVAPVDPLDVVVLGL